MISIHSFTSSVSLYWSQCISFFQLDSLHSFHVLFKGSFVLGIVSVLLYFYYLRREKRTHLHGKKDAKVTSTSTPSFTPRRNKASLSPSSSRFSFTSNPTPPPTNAILPCPLRSIPCTTTTTTTTPPPSSSFSSSFPLPPFTYFTWPCTSTKLHPNFNHEVKPNSLSIIIPSYNEAQRLPFMLHSLFSYFQAPTPVVSSSHRSFRSWFEWIEIIVVDDGSTDSTWQVAYQALTQFLRSTIHSSSSSPHFQASILQLQSNLGKGAAVKAGMVVSQGMYVLFADADGATPFQELDKLMNVIQDIAIGSRAHLVKEEAVIKRSFLRNFLMHSFHTIVMVFGVTHLQDTQCGFKLFRRSSAQTLFPGLHVKGWIFDLEFLLLAHWCDLKVKEIPVVWNEMEGSKMKLATDSIAMFLDLLTLRINYFLGTWQIPYAWQKQVELKEQQTSYVSKYLHCTNETGSSLHSE